MGHDLSGHSGGHPRDAACVVPGAEVSVGGKLAGSAPLDPKTSQDPIPFTGDELRASGNIAPGSRPFANCIFRENSFIKRGGLSDRLRTDGFCIF